MNIRKYFIGGVLGLFVLFGVIFWFNRLMDRQFEAGVESQRQATAVAVAEANKESQRLTDELNAANQTIVDMRAQRQQTVSNNTETVRTVIRTVTQDRPIYQDCKVDQDVVIHLNGLRSMSNE
jgi:serine phosphatase RsbU (regulator of sigma subunit)